MMEWVVVRYINPLLDALFCLLYTTAIPSILQKLA
jgi:hypothetical protein